MSQEAWQDDQMRTMCNLAFLRFFRSVDHFHRSYRTASHSFKTLQILDWIALTFVREPLGSAAAVAIAFSPGMLTLYLASNHGTPDAQDLHNSSEFLDMLHVALRLFHDNPNNRSVAGDMLIDWVLCAARAKVARKLELIEEMVVSHEKPVAQHLETLVRHWATKTREEDSNLLSFARQTFPEASSLDDSDVTATLMFLFRRLVNDIQEGRKERQTCVLALNLATSKFFQSIYTVQAVLCFQPHQAYWLRNLQRRLWRVGRYVSGAYLLVKTGFPMFAKVFGNNLGGFLTGEHDIRVEWVGTHQGVLPPGHGKEYNWPNSPEARLRQLLSHRASADLPIEGSFKDNLSNVWKEGDTIVANLHCELQLIHYLHENQIAVHRNMIGMSKLMCYACDEYLRSLPMGRHPRHRPWIITGSSGKAQTDWLMPPDRWGAYFVSALADMVQVYFSHLEWRARCLRYLGPEAREGKDWLEYYSLPWRG